MMKRVSEWAFVILIGIVLTVTVTGVAASQSRTVVYRLGESIVFRVVSAPMNCCCCQPGPAVKIMGWRVVDSCGRMIDSVTYKTPVSAAGWQGQWPKVNLTAVSNAEAKVEASSPGTVYQAWKNAMSAYVAYWHGMESSVSPGWYILYVDTTVGTLSRYLQLGDPTERYQPRGHCPCVQPVVRTDCCWQTRLVVSVNPAPHYRFLTWHVGPCRSRH